MVGKSILAQSFKVKALVIYNTANIFETIYSDEWYIQHKWNYLGLCPAVDCENLIEIKLFRVKYHFM